MTMTMTMTEENRTYSKKEAEILTGIEWVDLQEKEYTISQINEIWEKLIIDYAEFFSDWKRLQYYMRKKEQGKPICKPIEEGRVYFILTESNKVKIGFSKNVKSRFRHIKSENSENVTYLGSVFGSEPYEHHLQHKYHHIRHKGHWFYYTKELKQDIKILLADGENGENGETL